MAARSRERPSEEGDHAKPPLVDSVFADAATSGGAALVVRDWESQSNRDGWWALNFEGRFEGSRDLSRRTISEHGSKSTITKPLRCQLRKIYDDFARDANISGSKAATQ